MNDLAMALLVTACGLFTVYALGGALRKVWKDR